MQIAHFEEYRAKYQDTQLKIDSYIIRRMNLIANQTTVRLGDYNLLGALAMVSFAEAQVLAVLSPNEISHFSRFVAKPSTLVLAFDQSGSKEPVRFHLRVNMISITALPNRPNICLLRLVLKTIPPEFMGKLCDVLDDLAMRREAYDSKTDEMLEIDPKDFHLAAIKPRGEMSQGKNRLMADIKAVGLGRIRVSIDNWPFGVSENPRFSIKLVGIAGSFIVSGTIEDGVPGKAGTFELKLDFSNELIFNMEAWQTRLSIRARAAKTK